MRLDMLYTLDSKSKIRVFECEIKPQDDTSYNNYNYLVITRSGLLEGKLIKHEEIVKQGKQKRSVLEQARFQALSLWQEKWNEGYKSLQVLEDKADIHPGIYLASIIPHLERLFEKCPEAAYTNEKWDELPMLAQKYKDIKNPVFPYYIQPKLNGVRCSTKRKNTDIALCSRGGQYYKVPHIEEALINLYLKMPLLGKDILLDGELYKHGVLLQDISGAARKEESGLFASNNWLEYHIYDVIDLNNPKATQQERFNLMEQLAKLQNDGRIIKFLYNRLVHSKEQLKELHDLYITQGYEGAILRNILGTYDFNQRSKSLLKVKEYQDEEFIIIGCGYDDAKSLGESFYFILQNNINSLTFKARPTGTLKQKEDWYINQSWVGKKATVRFFERSKEGLPQQGSVRHNLSKILIEHIRSYGE